MGALLAGAAAAEYAAGGPKLSPTVAGAAPAGSLAAGAPKEKAGALAGAAAGTLLLAPKAGAAELAGRPNVNVGAEVVGAAAAVLPPGAAAATSLAAASVAWAAAAWLACTTVWAGEDAGKIRQARERKRIAAVQRRWRLWKEQLLYNPHPTAP